jgi:hypothetical protein
MRRQFIITAIVLLLGVIALSKVFGNKYEGFAIPNGRCGVNLPPCWPVGPRQGAGTKCMNGYCLRNEPPAQPPTTDFIIVP